MDKRHIKSIYRLLDNSQLEGVDSVPGVAHLMLSEDLTVCVSAKIFQRNATWQKTWSFRIRTKYKKDNRSLNCIHLQTRRWAPGAHCRCSDINLEIKSSGLEYIGWIGGAVQIRSDKWSNLSPNFLSGHLCQYSRIQRRRCQDDCHFGLQLLSSEII